MRKRVLYAKSPVMRVPRHHSHASGARLACARAMRALYTYNHASFAVFMIKSLQTFFSELFVVLGIKSNNEPIFKHDSVAANSVPQLPADLPCKEMVKREGGGWGKRKKVWGGCRGF